LTPTILDEDREVRGFNVGVNAGAVAGQTVMHSHIHLIPRRANDTVNPRGGVRGVIPGMQSY
jgi:ATP adenylyltransferase